MGNNPVTGALKRMDLKINRGENVEPLTLEKVRIFLDTCNWNFKEYCPFFLCEFRTGTRLGELLALQWRDVDWNGNFMQVSRSYKRGWINPTKMGKIGVLACQIN